MAPAGQLWSTTGDLLRFAAFLAEGDDRVLRAASVEQMREPSAPPETGGWESQYGLGLQLVRTDGRTLFGHTGSLPGFLATLWVDVEDDVTAVVLANATSGPMVGGVAADLVKIVAEAEPRIPEPWRPLPAVDTELLALTGPWYWGTHANILRLTSDGGLDLQALRGNGRGARFTAQPDGTWVGLNGYYAGRRCVSSGTPTAARTIWIWVRSSSRVSRTIPRRPYPAVWTKADGGASESEPHVVRSLSFLRCFT